MIMTQEVEVFSEPSNAWVLLDNIAVFQVFVERVSALAIT